MDISFSNIIALLALGLSGYAVFTTSRFNRRQLSLIDSQEKLNKRLLEQGQNEDVEARKADVGASLVRLGSSNYRLKVFNKGKGTARNVQIEFAEGNEIAIDSDVAEKFPMEVLESHQHVDLIAAVHMGTPRKQSAILRWEDDHKRDNEKTVYLTL